MNPIKRFFELLNLEIIEDDNFIEMSTIFFENNLSFSELQMNLKDKDRKKGLEKLMIFADHLVLNKITCIKTIKNREYIN